MARPTARKSRGPRWSGREAQSLMSLSKAPAPASSHDPPGSCGAAFTIQTKPNRQRPVFRGILIIVVLPEDVWLEDSLFLGIQSKYWVPIILLLLLIGFAHALA